ncbi:MAG: GtrA family protein [Chitinophagaceae bacterium]|nr:GtrA family protein [Chitinophagaceae bacterium]
MAILKQISVHKTRNIILRLIDFFHPPFARWIDQQTFRYLACGGSNQLLNIFIYGVSFNFFLQKRDFAINNNLANSVGIAAITGPIAAYVIASAITIPIGFLLSKYVVFQESNIKGRIQLFRYMSLVLVNFILNYWLLKLFINVFNIYPTPSQTITIIILAIFSYLVQRYFTFKVSVSDKEEVYIEEQNLTN